MREDAAVPEKAAAAVYPLCADIEALLAESAPYKWSECSLQEVMQARAPQCTIVSRALHSRPRQQVAGCT